MATVAPTAVSRKGKKAAAAPAEPQPQEAQERPEAAVPPGRSILRKLGLIGLDRIEPVILAALVQREPLLLVGNHGTGKSLLLNRLAQALGLEHRHYNASLLSFDDLVGYPLPDPNGTLRFVQTPASIWGAQSVFFDEISRCRPEMQNKLFSLIHERRVQGIDLDRLIYRWSAMNPPSADSESNGYFGSEPLDLALADRFAFIVRVPDWNEMAAADQERLLHASQEEPQPGASSELRFILQQASTLYDSFRRSLLEPLGRYVRLLGVLMVQAKLPMSGRRAAMLVRNICAVHAVRSVVSSRASLEEAAKLALFHSLPQEATEQAGIPRLKLASAHREAWNSMDPEKSVETQALLREADLVRRAALAIGLKRLSPAEVSTVIADCLVQLPHGAKEALAAWLFEQGHAGRLVAAVADQCASVYSNVASSQTVRKRINGMSPLVRVWRAIVQCLGELPADDPETRLITNLLFSHFNSGNIKTPEDVDGFVERWRDARKKLDGGRP